MRKYTDTELRRMANFPTLEQAGVCFGISRQRVQVLLGKYLGVRKHEVSDPDLLSTRQVANLLGKSEVTLRAWRRKRMGPVFVRLSQARIRYRLRDVESWIQDRSKRT